MPLPKKNISDKEIYNLREQGLTYREIVKYFEEKGMIISVETIRKRCKKMFEEEGKKVPKANRIKEITDEEIYKLREQGIAYENILKYFEEKGVNISYGTIRERCKRIYSEKGESEPKAIRKKEIANEEIYKLREQGMTYQEILNYFEEKDIKASYGLIRERCKEIYKEKGKEEPKLKRGKKVTDKKIDELGDKNGKKNIINSQDNEETLEELDQILNEKIKQKIEMERILKILVEYINENKRGIEK